MKRRFTDAVLVTIGFILSPLSWWNDMVVNVPLAYVFSYPFSLIDQQLFLPSFILGYWLSNLLGFLMLHWGGERLIGQSQTTISIRRSLIISIIYSIIVIILVLLDWLAPPTEMLARFQ
jgi:hypothetical protein